MDCAEDSFSSSIGSDDLAEVAKAESNWYSKKLDCAELSFSSSIGSDDLTAEAVRAEFNWNSKKMDCAEVSFSSSIGSDELAEVTRAESNWNSKNLNYAVELEMMDDSVFSVEDNFCVCSEVGHEEKRLPSVEKDNLVNEENMNEEQMSIESVHENEFLATSVYKGHMETIRKLVIEDGKVSKYTVFLFNLFFFFIVIDLQVSF